MGDRFRYHVLEGRTQLRRSIHACTKLVVGCGIAEIARHDIDESQGGVAEPSRRRIAETDQHAGDLDGVPGGLDIEPFEEICRRSIIEPSRPVQRLLGVQKLTTRVDEFAPARSIRRLGAAVERQPRGLRTAGKAGLEEFFRAGTRHGCSVDARDVDCVVIGEDGRGQPKAVPCGVGEQRVLAEVRGAERGAPAAPKGQVVDRGPVEADLRIAGAAEIAVLVVAPGGFEVQSSDQRDGVHVAEDGDVQLPVHRPERSRLRIGKDVDQGTGLTLRELGEDIVVADVTGAHGPFDSAGRQIEQRAVGLDGLLIDPERLGGLAVEINITQRSRGVALDRPGIAKQVQIGDGGGLHKTGDARFRAGGWRCE